MMRRRGDGFFIDMGDSAAISFFFIDYDENDPAKLKINQHNREFILKNYGNIYNIQDPKGKKEFLFHAHKLIKTYHDLNVIAIFGRHGKNEYIEFIMPEVIVIYIQDKAKISEEQYKRFKERDGAKNLDANCLYYAAKESE